MAARAGMTASLRHPPLATPANTNNTTSHIASTSSPAAYDDLQRHLYFAHLTPTSTTSSDGYESHDHDYHWHHHTHRNHQYSPWASPVTAPILKSEYSNQTINMAGIPTAPSSDIAKHEYRDSTSHPNLHDVSRSRTPADGRIEMDQDEVDAIIRNKRKVRDPKACYACHRRKVKCDRNLPCDSCVKRDHPELCSYERPTKKKRIALNNHATSQGGDNTHSEGADVTMSAGANITVPKEQWDRINFELNKLRSVLNNAQQGVNPASVSSLAAETEGEEMQTVSRGDTSEREGVHAPSIQMGTMHLGSRSVLAYMVGDRSKKSQDAARMLLEENILPNLGLDNETATYPFVDLWSTESSISDVSGLCRALPEDALVLDSWKSYRDVACAIYPVVPDTVQFEQQLKYMLQQRAEHNHQGLDIDPSRPYGVTVSWISLVFAVLASGVQCGVLPAKERELTSQVYICCAYQALRMANFLSHHNLDTIQTCLIIGNALSYNMNPGVSYIFLGMTLRGALTMGLHVNSNKFSEYENYLRGRIWWALAWQDSHFSVSYDRPSSSILCYPEIPYAKGSTPGNRDYVESASAIIRLTQEILRDRTLNPQKTTTFSAVQRYRDAVSRIIDDAAPWLRDSSLCKTTIEHMQRCAFILHSSYMLSEICRPALKESSQLQTTNPVTNTPNASPKGHRKSSLSGQSSNSPTSTSADINVQAQLRTECYHNLERTIQAYVEIQRHSMFTSRSWVGIQRSISAAFLLGLVPETRQEPRILSLLVDLEQNLAIRVTSDLGYPPNPSGSPVFQANGHGPVDSDSNRLSLENAPSWAPSMIKSLTALRKLNATLAAPVVTQSSPSVVQHNRYQQKPQSQQQPAASGYATPVVSPIPTLSSTAVPTSGSHQHQSAQHNQLSMNQYPSAGSLPAHLQHHGGQQRSQPMGSPTTSMGSPSMGNNSAPSYMSGPTSGSMAPVTPESAASSSDWHYGNLAERALEYVQPGLWG